METKKLLIDKDCPMCNLYGKCFVELGMLEQEGIAPYQYIDSSVSHNIDMDRARNEIALYDEETKNTVYGVEAIATVLGRKSKLLKAILMHPFAQALIKPLYKFISYNRKVIYPVGAKPSHEDCFPDLNITYRWLYIFFVAFFTGVILNIFTFRIAILLGIEPAHPIREYIICFGQILWQGASIYLLSKEKIHEYLGNMSTVSLIGGLLLIPILLVHQFLGLGLWYLLIGFGIVVSIMLLEHIRRCRLLNIPIAMTLSWIAYRTFVLLVIISTLYLI